MSIDTFSQKTTNDTLSLSKQFEQVYRRSSSYKDFKVIRKTTFQNLKNNALDSIKSIDEKFKIESQKSLRLEQEINNISKIRLEQDLELSKAILKKNTISFVGLKLKKNTFKIIIWSIFLTLIILTCFFAYKIKDEIKSHVAFKKFNIKVKGAKGEPGTYEVTGKKKDILAYLQSEFYEMDDETVEEYYPELLEGNSFEVYDAIITKASN